MIFIYGYFSNSEFEIKYIFLWELYFNFCLKEMEYVKYMDVFIGDKYLLFIYVKGVW